MRIRGVANKFRPAGHIVISGTISNIFSGTDKLLGALVLTTVGRTTLNSTITYNTIQNAAPIWQAVGTGDPAELVVTQGSTVTISGLASDPDNDPITLTIVDPLTKAPISDLALSGLTWNPAGYFTASANSALGMSTEVVLCADDNKSQWSTGTFAAGGAFDGGCKHVDLLYYGGRVYDGGGDFTGVPYTALTGPLPDGRYVNLADQSLRNDRHSFNPLSASPISFRLEHPYICRDLGGGVRERKIGRPDQIWFWERQGSFYSYMDHYRVSFARVSLDSSGNMLDAAGNIVTDVALAEKNVWANADPQSGVWKFTPNPAGGSGTWTNVTPSQRPGWISLEESPSKHGAYHAGTDRAYGLYTTPGNLWVACFDHATATWLPNQNITSQATAELGTTFLNCDGHSPLQCCVGENIYGTCVLRYESDSKWHFRLRQYNVVTNTHRTFRMPFPYHPWGTEAQIDDVPNSGPGGNFITNWNETFMCVAVADRYVFIVNGNGLNRPDGHDPAGNLIPWFWTVAMFDTQEESWIPIPNEGHEIYARSAVYIPEEKSVMMMWNSDSYDADGLGDTRADFYRRWWKVRVL